MRKLETELLRFDQLRTSLSSKFEVESVAEDLVVMSPKNLQSAYKFQAIDGDRDVTLTLIGLIHGVEVAGVAVICDLMETLIKQDGLLNVKLGLGLGNRKAALLGKRFVDRDLNRSFARVETATIEDVRADELEILLRRSQNFLDFHQVKLHSPTPFWIFPYKKSSFDLARNIDSTVPIVTHWGRGFSSEGQCSDEFVNKTGGTGITIELGKNGFDEIQIAKGVAVSLQALQFLSQDQQRAPYRENPNVNSAPIYTWAEIIPYPKTSLSVLRPDLSNFVELKKGDVIGTFNGNDVTSPVDGWTLFPKYPDSITPSDTGVPPALEMLRIMKKIGVHDLPHGGH